MEQEKQIITIENNYVKIIKDVSLMKNLLTPLELYLLKDFIIYESPQTIRDIQLKTLRLIFNAVYYRSPRLEQKDAISLLKKEGYGIGNLENKHDDIKNILETTNLHDEVKKKTSLLRKHKIKTPSYDLIQSILEDFVKTGILKKRARDRNSVYYLLNPEFVIMFKSKFKEILNL